MKNLAWRVSNGSCQHAKRLVIGGEWETAPESATRLRLSAFISSSPLDPHRDWRVKNVGGVDIASLDRPLEVLESSPTFCSQVKKLLRKKHILPANVRRIVGKIGSRNRRLFEYSADFLIEGPATDPSA